MTKGICMGGSGGMVVHAIDIFGHFDGSSVDENNVVHKSVPPKVQQGVWVDVSAEQLARLTMFNTAWDSPSFWTKKTR